jgi:hypothetical protein
MGHSHRDGEQMRKRHRRYQTVAMINEHRNSQICASYFHPMMKPLRLQSVSR